MIAYTCGSYDILRAKDLQDLDMKIQLSKEKGINHFGIGIYDNNLCENLGLNLPLKSLEDRMQIAKQLRGVDFVFPVSSLDKNWIKKKIETLQLDKDKTIENSKDEKQYELAYAPGTYDLFHAGHLENLLEAAKKSKKLIVGVKSDELVMQHKGKTPILSDYERVEILRHFKFVYDVYVYYTRDPHIANDWIKSKYGHEIDAIFLGSDLKNDFEKFNDLNIIYTERDSELMKTRSTTAYAKTYKTLKLGNPDSRKYTGNIDIEEINKKEKKLNETDELSLD